MKHHANLLNPAFQTQLELRRVLGGPKFWKKETKRLTELCKEEKVIIETTLWNAIMHCSIALLKYCICYTLWHVTCP